MPRRLGRGGFREPIDRFGIPGSSPGFTLIEILVVVAIIALLVAILIPSLHQAREQAKRAVCLARMHDVGTSFVVYTETYKGWYPITASAGTDSFYSLWKAKLLKSTELILCPATKNVVRPHTLQYPERYDEESDQDDSIIVPYQGLGKNDSQRSDLEHSALGGKDDDTGGHSYEYNSIYDGGDHPLGHHHKQTKHFMFPPSQMLLVHDNDNRYDFIPVNRQEFGCENAVWGGNNCPQPWDNHGAKGMDMMFGDGHARWVPKQAGTYEDFRSSSGGTPPVRVSKNASIDRIFLKSQYPWAYSSKHRR